MPYATNNKLSTSPIEGGIEITPAEYADALADMQEGKRLSIEVGQMVLAFPAPPEPEPEPEPTPEELLAAERTAMSATRGQFLIAAVGAGIITEATAEEAAGGGWPAAFDTFMAGLNASQRIAAKAAWVDGDNVRRTNPILALIAADQSVSPEAVDDLFRAAMEIDL